MRARNMVGRKKYDRGLVKSDETLFSIIEYVRAHGPIGVTDVANHLDLSKSSVHKHLKTLEKEGWVTNSDGEYKLSFKFLTIGGEMRDEHHLCSLAHPLLRELANETDQVVLLSLFEQNQGVFVQRYNERYGIGKAVYEGRRYNLHHTASGKAMLAELSEEQTRQIIDEYDFEPRTGNTITTREELAEELGRVREQGYAMNLEEGNEGIHAIGVAIPDSTTPAAVCVGGPASRLPEERLRNEFAEILLNKVNEIQLRLRYQ